MAEAQKPCSRCNIVGPHTDAECAKAKVALDHARRHKTLPGPCEECGV